jgi:glycosyltransferase involved in cell wall biosynthesis
MVAACPFPANHGTPGAIRELSEGVVALGHRVDVVTYHFGEDIPVRGPSLHRIPKLTGERRIVVGPTSRKPLYDALLALKTVQVAERYGADLIHAHGYESALAAWCARLVTGLPVVYSAHNTMGDELASYGAIKPRWVADALASALDAFVPRMMNLCLPHTSNLAKFLRNMGLASSTAPVVNFGIDLVGRVAIDRTEVRNRYGLGNGPVVVYSGVLDRFQRIDLLLEAMVEVKRAVPEAQLLIVSTIPSAVHEAAVRAEAERLGLTDRLVLTPPQTLSGVRELLAAADVAVVPRPQAPGLPIKLLNYMDAELPCVLFASSATAGLVDGENVAFAAEDTGVSLGSAMVRVIGNPALARRLSTNCGELVRKKYDRRAVAEGVVASYHRLLAKRS